ncbi:putative F-box-like/WD repeat-containing protein TBL1X [Halenospora varia]|nr:putative F-box-like/WD repeat-containing protein TBL1X [Halenospora varia]
MTKESLDSDRVNYMIWRGLLYSVVDREDAPVNSNDGEAVTGFFGPLTPAATAADAADEDDFENARKRQIDNEQPQISNGPSAKRQRLSNGYENGFETTPMDLDDDANADENAYPSPEQLPSPVVATDGPEKGTQIDKVCELSTETVFLELSDDQASRNAVLLQCEWNPRDPTILAAAGTDALARMWTLRGTGAEADPNAQFNPGGTLISIMYPARDQAVHYSLPQHSLHDQALDATWTSDEAFVLCGGDILQGFQCVEDAISPIRKYETREGHALSKITFDWQSGLLATASDTGTIDVWDQLGQCRSFNAHQGVITSLIWQPLPSPHALPDNMERFLASAGEDGAISVWNARTPDSKSKCSMTMSSAVVSLAFTPDGAFIAGATADRILIWKVDEASLPRASWIRSDQAGWRTPMSQDSNTDENSYSLSWDANGQKLAYGVNTSLAVITFRR